MLGFLKNFLFQVSHISIHKNFQTYVDFSSDVDLSPVLDLSLVLDLSCDLSFHLWIMDLQILAGILPIFNIGIIFKKFQK